MTNKLTDSDADTLLKATAWYSEHFYKGDYQLAAIDKDFASRGFWFAGEYHIHKGNQYRPVVVRTDRVLNTKGTGADAMLGERIIFLPVTGPQGPRAYRWVLVKHLLAAYSRWRALTDG